MMKRISLAFVVGLFACNGDDDGTDDNTVQPKPTDCFNEQFVDATAQDVWIYFDLESGTFVTPANPDDSTEWDIAFQRFKVASNGGISGTGGVEVAIVDGTECNDLMEAPAGPYRMDAPDGDDPEETPDYAFSFGPTSNTGPWGYDEPTHQLFDSGATYVVKTVEGNYYKLRFSEYYGPTATAAELTFSYNTVTPPTELLPPGAIKVPAPLAGGTFLKLDGTTADVTDLTMDTTWDLQVTSVTWRTNGGLMRSGEGGARISETSDFDAVASAPTMGYLPDVEIDSREGPLAGKIDANPAMADWFEYTGPPDHLAVPFDMVFYVRGAGGNYGKLKVLEYDSEGKEYILKIATLPREVETRSISVDGSDVNSFTYYNLRTAQIVDPDDPSSSLDWDLGLSRTRIRTNGGTSGSGDGGASGPIAMPYAEITDAPNEYQVDAMIPDPENAGSMVSSNPNLHQWFETTGSSTTAQDVTFVVRTADGNFAKVKVTDWSDGEFDLDVSYAGPGEDTF